MAAKNNPDARLAAELAQPFQTGGKPLSFRALPDGGMVVITADGRKLWFTCREANVARQKLGLAAVRPTAQNDGLIDEDVVKAAPKKPLPPPKKIFLPPDLQYLERMDYDQADIPGRPRTPARK